MTTLPSCLSFDCNLLCFFPRVKAVGKANKTGGGQHRRSTWTLNFLAQLRGFWLLKTSQYFFFLFPSFSLRISSNLSSFQNYQQILIPKMPSSLQVQSSTFRALHLHLHRPPQSSFWGTKDLCCYNNSGGVALNPAAGTKQKNKKNLLCSNGGTVRVFAMSNDSTPFKMNLNEYMVTLEKPLGIRFALSVNGKVFVHALKKGVFPSLSSFLLSSNFNDVILSI